MSCCRCNRSGRCANCSCVKGGGPCQGCLPQRLGNCLNTVSSRQTQTQCQVPASDPGVRGTDDFSDGDATLSATSAVSARAVSSNQAASPSTDSSSSTYHPYRRYSLLTSLGEHTQGRNFVKWWMRPMTKLSIGDEPGTLGIKWKGFCLGAGSPFSGLR